MAKNQTAISNEEIVAALLTSGSIAQAAEAAGISQRTLYDRMNEKTFKQAYTAAKSDIVRQAVVNLNGHLAEAFNVIAEIMRDDKQPASTRLQAAKAVIECAERFADRLETADRRTADSLRRFPHEY